MHPQFQDEAATLRTLNAFAVDLIAIPNVEDLFWYVAQNVVGHLNFFDCVIYRANEDQTILTQVAALGEKNPFGRSIINPLEIPFGKGITGRVAQLREAIVVDDLSADESYIADTQPARSEICVPLVYRNRVVGVIDCEHPNANAFGPAELEVLTTVAAMTSAKLELLEEANRSNQRYHDLIQSHAKLSEETASRRALEAELFEARKLEAIGRLTGRFAHDFNNFLTVISGNLELFEAIEPSPDARVFLDEAKAAASRGAKLIRDMLAFSQRMRLETEVVDLNQVVKVAFSETEDPTAAVVELTLADGLWPTQTDPSVARQAVLNLIQNAREATPATGKVRVATENLTHAQIDKQSLKSKLKRGDYVCLIVQDEGNGIPDDQLQQIFDPFFSTKPICAGTGLGLSMVIGFMQQSGGAVAVTSGANMGTVFRLYFPTIPNRANDLLTTFR